VRNQFTDALKGHNADYVEVHFEESESTHIICRSGSWEEISRTCSSGGNIRALVKGSWGFVSFNHLDKLRGKVMLAVDEARLASGEEFGFPAAEPVVDTVTQELERSLAAIPLVAKKRLLDEYNSIILGSSKIQSSRIDYRDVKRKVTFVNSEGSYIEQSKPDIALRLTAIACQGNEVQQAGLSLGSNGDFSAVEGLHDQVQEIARRAASLLSAPHVKGGEHTVILDPVLAGVFVHEAFGHLSEADFVYQNKQLYEYHDLGAKIWG